MEEESDGTSGGQKVECFLSCLSLSLSSLTLSTSDGADKPESEAFE